MGILNVTPDSFSDGGQTMDQESIQKIVYDMESGGVDIIDIGGESTRPGADPVPMSVELDRVIPAIQAVRAISSIPISIDTTKGEVARAALEAGANMINDVSAGQRDPAMLSLAASKHVPVRVFNVLCTDSE